MGIDTLTSVPVASPSGGRDLRPVGLWLLACCAMVVVMIVLGGLTRLTQSGLSMVEWQPLTVLPPLSETAWQEMFAKYQLSPEYRLKNIGMDLTGFKEIFWLEYIHRLWGRLIGFVFFLPFVVFLVTRRIDRSLALTLAGLFLLGGLQGGMGWIMVKSGLADRPDVSQYRLTAHLGLALAILGGLLWVALGCLRSRRDPAPVGAAGLFRWVKGLLALVVLTILSGGFVAGLDAGLAYNTFPLMDGGVVPGGVLAMTPWYLNLFENAATVQFDHRLLAVTTLVLILGVWNRSRPQRLSLSPQARRAMDAFAGMAVLQVVLGISTLLLVVPVPLAAAHQAGAVVLFCLGLWLARELK